MNYQRKSRRSDAGFTLLEMLVVIAIVSMLLPIVVGSLNSFVRLFERARSAANTNYEILAFLRYTDGLMERAKPLPIVPGEERGAPIFSGSKYRIAFVAAQDERWSDGGLTMITMEVIEAGGSRALVQRRCPWSERSQGASCGPGGRLDTLLSGFTDISFTFYDGQAGSWSGSWEFEERMPILMKMRIDGGGVAAVRVIALPVALML